MRLFFRVLLVETKFSGQTYLMMNILSRAPDRDTYINTKSHPEQYSNSKIKIMELCEKIKPLSENENATKVFDDILDSANSKDSNQFILRGSYNNLDIYHL